MSKTAHILFPIVYDADNADTWGTWRLAPPEGAAFYLTVCLRCPECGRAGFIDPTRYKIDDNGVVTPQLVCGNMKCDFDRPILLEDWEQHKPR